MQTIKEYALRHKITYEAARQQVNRHADKLGKNLVKIGRTRYLTDEGVAILEGGRNKNTATAKRDETQEELNNLSYQYNMILQKWMETQEKLIDSQKNVIDVKQAFEDAQAQIITLQKELLDTREKLDTEKEKTQALELQLKALQSGPETLSEAPQWEGDSTGIGTPTEELETPQKASEQPLSLWRRLLDVFKG